MHSTETLKNFFNIHEVLLWQQIDVFKQYLELLCVQVYHCASTARA